jgi:hypothetical protein
MTEIKYFAILIDGDVENSLGGACSRDVWNIAQKIIKDVPIDTSNIYTFFHNSANDRYAKKISEMKITKISESNLENIKKCFNEIVGISHKEKTVVFYHYSGHGYQIPDLDGDEIDGSDEAFLGRQMTDDFIWDNLVSKLSSSSYIFALLDACHSGSGMDMPYLWKNQNWILAKKKKIDADCSGFSMSACNDTQCSSQDVGETTGFSGSLIAAVCDHCNLLELINNPLKYYDIVSSQLKKLNQNVEIYSVKK